jgi:hypothetical protein
MADNVDITAVDPSIGVDATVAADVISGVAFQRVKLTLGADGVNDDDVSAANPIPVTGSVSAAVTGSVSATVTGTVTANTGLTQPLTDAQLRATSVQVSTALDAAIDTHASEILLNVHDPDLDTGGGVITVLGSQGVPLTQNEKGGEEFGLNSLFVRDLDLQTVLGTQSLLSSGRLKVESGYYEQIVSGVLRTATAGMEVMFDCSGFNSLTVELMPAQAGAWTGTVTFEAMMAQTWYSMLASQPTMVTPSATTTTSGIFRFNIAGFTKFRARCSTAGTLNAFVLAKLSTAPGVIVGAATAIGSLAVPLSQKATTFEANTYDTGLNVNTVPTIASMKDALTVIEPWSTLGTYVIGDTVLWNGYVYRCILGTSTLSPTTVANWILDPRQNKSVATRDLISPVNAPRLRVEIDLDDYQIRMQEETLLVAKMDMQSRIISQEYQLEVLQAGVSNGIYFGKAYLTGPNAVFDEIR